MLQSLKLTSSGGAVDFRLARAAVLREVARGRLSRRDVCDAHPELLRAARNVGIASGEACPLCEEGAIVHVTYAFGPRLPPGGRCPGSSSELAKLCRSASVVACYVVEVCPDCSWNHLVRMFPAGSPTVRGSRRRGAAEA